MDNATALVNLLPLASWNVEVGREVVEALGRLGAGAVPALAHVLRDLPGGAVTRATAARLLGRIGGRTAAEALCGARAESDPAVAAAIRRALRDVGEAPCTHTPAA